MPNLFLDIETAPQFTKEEYFKTKKEIDSGKLNRHSENKDLFWRFDRGGLTPFDGKVILITYKINNGHVFRLKEWETGEREILKKFYELVVDLQRGGGEDRLKIIVISPLELNRFLDNLNGTRKEFFIKDDKKYESQQWEIKGVTFDKRHAWSATRLIDVIQNEFLTLLQIRHDSYQTQPGDTVRIFWTVIRPVS